MSFKNLPTAMDRRKKEVEKRKKHHMVIAREHNLNRVREWAKEEMTEIELIIKVKQILSVTTEKAREYVKTVYGEL